MASTIKPSHEVQMRPLVLDITPGLDGYRLAFVGGAHYDAVAEFASDYDVKLARAEAALAILRLRSVLRNARAS